MAGEHFLDAAIIIGRILSWDAQRQPVQAYFARSNVTRHTSEHVSRGVRNTLFAIRRSFREYTVQLDHDIRGFDGTRLVDELRRHLRNYVDARLNIRTLTPNLAGQLRQLAGFFENSKFRNAHHGTGRAEDAAYEVDSAIDKALTELALMCRNDVKAAVRVHACPPDIRTTHSAIHAQVQAIMGGHADDALVATEAYHIHKTAVNPLRVLVTTDRAHFLSNKNALDRVLLPLAIEHPDRA